MLLAVYFIHNQLYSYLLPKIIRDKPIYTQANHYSKSFFSGTVGSGYFLVVLHLFGIYMSASSTHKFEGFLYIGVFLIFCGTLSKIKGIIVNELAERNSDNS